MTSAKHILVAVHTNTFFTELRVLVEYLVSNTPHTPVVMFYGYPTSTHDAQRMQALGVKCVNETGLPFGSAPGLLASFNLMPLRLLSPLRKASQWFDTAVEIAVISRREREVRMLIERNGFDICIVGGDMTGYDTAAFIRASQTCDAPVAIVPSTMSDGLEQLEVYYDDPRHWADRSRFNRRTALKYPKWSANHKARNLLREPAPRIRALEHLRLAPDRPWSFNSGNADIIAIESLHMEHYYKKGGIFRVAITGSPSNDQMADVVKAQVNYRQQLYDDLALDPKLPLLLTALPPDCLYFPGGRPECDFTEYEELVRFWVEGVASVPGYNKVVALHPSVEPGSMKHLEKSGIKIADRETAKLVPLCDLYVASVSSTIRWAIACSKPTLNYDVYRFRYNDYRSARGVIAVEDKAEFLEVLQRFATDMAFFEATQRQQAEDSGNWAVLDGKANARIVSLIEVLGRTSIAEAGTE